VENLNSEIMVNKIDPSSGQVFIKSFPLLDIIPSEVSFGVTGLNFTPESYYWDFGDGNESTERDPVHTYQTYGYHKVLASVKDRSGTWFSINATGSHDIVLSKLDFSGDPREGDRPLSVNFKNNSIASTGLQFTGLQWSFGDAFGMTGAQAPTHTYTDHGTYTVGLSVTLDKIE